MDQFINWETLTTYTTFVTIVFMVVEFTKEMKFINKIPTKYWSFVVTLGLLVIVNMVIENFKPVDLVLYSLSSISISLGSNGLSNFNKKGGEKIE